MALNVQNRYSAPISIMIEYLHPPCRDFDGFPWQKTGWYNLDPGQQKVVFRGGLNLINRFWYFYAQATDGTRWMGSYPELVRSAAFRECAGLADNVNYHSIGMRELDIAGQADYWLVLTA